MTVRKQELIYGVSMVTNDVYHVSEIEDVSYGRATDSLANEFSFKYNKGKSQLVLSTPKRETVVSVSNHVFLQCTLSLTSLLGGTPRQFGMASEDTKWRNQQVYPNVTSDRTTSLEDC